MTEPTSQTFGQAAETAIAAVSQGLSRTASQVAADNAHKRAFLEMFRRWEVLFKRADKGDVNAEKWLIAEYYASLGHLSEAGFRALTDRLKETCTFFPSIKECLDATRCDRYDWGNPFRALNDGGDHAMLRHQPPARLAAPVAQIAHHDA